MTRTGTRLRNMLLEEGAAWKRACDVFFKLTDNSKDKRLQSILEREWLKQFTEGEDTLHVRASHYAFPDKEYERGNVDFMIGTFLDADGPVQGMGWHEKFFQRSANWCIADSIKWAERIVLEWERGLVGQDAELCELY